MKRTGLKAWIFFDKFDNEKVISGGDGITTEANKWYVILEKGEGSELPFEVGFPFKSPVEEQLPLIEGDRVFPIDERRFCKTSASLSVEQGTVDVSDDCDPGATLLDGMINYSGSLAGLFRYDNETDNFSDVTEDMLNRFFDIVEDHTTGKYDLKPRSDEPMYMLCCLNSNAKVGQIENWIFMPINISSMSVSLGNTDAQNKDLSWSKGEGRAVIYKRPRPA